MKYIRKTKILFGINLALDQFENDELFYGPSNKLQSILYHSLQFHKYFIANC